MSLKNLFVKQEVIVKPQVKSGETVKVSRPVLAPTQEVDSEIKEALLQSMQESKLSGFDYLKFQATLEETKELSSDESARFKMAALAGKQLGVDKTKLVSTAQHYLEVLENDSKDFNKDLTKRQKDLSKQDKIDELLASIKDHQDTITKLQEEVAQFKTEVDSLTAENFTETAKLSAKKAAFEATYKSLTEEIQTNINKINKYL